MKKKKKRDFKFEDEMKLFWEYCAYRILGIERFWIRRDKVNQKVKRFL